MSTTRNNRNRKSLIYLVTSLLLCCMLCLTGLAGSVWAADDEAGPDWDPAYLAKSWPASGLNVICDSDGSHNIEHVYITDYVVTKKYRVDKFFFYRDVWCFEVIPKDPAQYFPKDPAHEACGESVPLRIYCDDNGKYLGSLDGEYHCRCQAYTPEFRWNNAENLKLSLPVDTNVYANVEKAREAANAAFPKQTTATGTDGYTYLFSGWDEGVVKDKTIIFTGNWEKVPGQETAEPEEQEKPAVQTGTTGKTETTVRTAATTKTATKAPETEDTTDLTPWAAALMTASGLLGAGVYMRRRSRSKS